MDIGTTVNGHRPCLCRMLYRYFCVKLCYRQLQCFFDIKICSQVFANFTMDQDPGGMVQCNPAYRMTWWSLCDLYVKFTSLVDDAEMVNEAKLCLDFIQV